MIEILIETLTETGTDRERVENIIKERDREKRKIESKERISGSQSHNLV